MTGCLGLPIAGGLWLGNAKMNKPPQKKNDTTSTQRGRKRIADLNAIAASFGFPTWRKFETAVLNRYYEKMNSAK